MLEQENLMNNKDSSLRFECSFSASFVCTKKVFVILENFSCLRFSLFRRGRKWKMSIKKNGKFVN